jgi:broad specificity phosphatase PhoE
MRFTSSIFVLCLSTGKALPLRSSKLAGRQLQSLIVTQTKRSMTAASSSSSDPSTATPVAPKTKRTFDIYPYGTTEEDIKSSGDYCHTKVVHFVRHSEGTHNVNKEYQAILNLDARLTEKGQEQCRSLADEIRQAATATNLSHLSESAQLVVTSPLTRCIQTALLSFPMLAERQVPFVAHPGVRETVNYNCDRRRNVKDIQQDFGKDVVDFTHVPTDHDDVWESYEKRLGCHETWSDPRESAEIYAAAERGRGFMEWLQTRPEEHVVVCSHRAFLRCFWNFGVNGEAVPFLPPQALDNRQAEDATDVPVVRYCGDQDGFAESLQRCYDNCELRSLVVAFRKD